MRTLVAIIIAVACGAAIGASSVLLKIRQYAWKGGIESPTASTRSQVAVEQTEFDFGRMDSSEIGKHEFKFTNRGDHKLTLSRGASSCGCTVSEIPDGEVSPGQSAKVLVTWRSKNHIGRFHQSVNVLTSDPLRPEITLVIKGEFTRSLFADPDELTFGQIPGTEPVTREARIFCNL